MKIVLGIFLAISVALNVFLWTRVNEQRADVKASEAKAAEAEASRRQAEELQATRVSAQPAPAPDIQELARLRNEVGQLRKQATDANAQREQAAREVAQLRSQLAAQRLEEQAKAAAGVQMTAEQLQQARAEAQAIACVNNMKQIGLAARIWANDHGNVFPPDLASMKNELNTPKILFCPAAPGGVQAADWSQLNPATISYQFLNPNGNESDPQKVLTTCPIHGHVGLSDGSVQRKR